MIPPKYLLTRQNVRVNVPIVGNVCNRARGSALDESGPVSAISKGHLNH